MNLKPKWFGSDFLPPYVVVACSTVFFWSLSVRYLIFSLLPAISEEFGLSTAATSIAASAFTLGHCVTSWVAGWLPGSRKRRILIGILLSLLGAVMVSASQDLWTLVGSGLFLGLALGVYLPLGLAIISEEGGVRKKARYTSVQEIAATFAMFGGASFVALTLGRGDWRTSILLWCSVGIISLIVFLFVSTKSGQPTDSKLGRSLPFDSTLACCCISYLGSSMLIAGLISVLPLILVRGWGINQSEAASVVGYTRLAGIVGVGIVGLRADDWGHSRVLTGLQLLGVAGCLGMAINGYGSSFLVGVVAVAIAASGMVTVLPAVIANAYPVEQREQALGVSIALGSLLGSAAAPALFGILVDLNMPNGPMVVALGTILTALLASRRIPVRQD